MAKVAKAVREYQNCLCYESCRLKEDFRDILSTKKYYLTPEICRELAHIDNGVNHLKLGSDLLNHSKSVQHYTNKMKMNHEYGSYAAILNAREGIDEIKKRMNVCKVKDYQDLEIRQAHHNTMCDLWHIEKEMKPFVHNTVHRLNEYCANLGVTDRFQGYRNNINIGVKDPIICAPVVDGKVDEEICPKDECCDCCCEDEMTKKLKTQSVKSIQEQCGINMCFPGISEYIEKYQTPERPVFLKYVINPTPKYGRDGRKMAVRAKVPMITNYTENFQWPDDCKLPHYPWLRK